MAQGAVAQQLRPEAVAQLGSRWKRNWDGLDQTGPDGLKCLWANAGKFNEKKKISYGRVWARRKQNWAEIRDMRIRAAGFDFF
jgi:hypothetical protein